MRFLIKVYDTVEIDDNTILDYVQRCKNKNKKYNSNDFYNWLISHYCVGDFIIDEKEEIDLSTKYLIDEINQTIEDNND